MGYKEDAELVTKHIETMEKAGGELLDKAGAYNPLPGSVPGWSRCLGI
ncbi:MAG: hypothetical protein V8Q36_03380 [Anaerotignum sp.]